MIDNEILRRNARMQLGGGIFHSRWLNMLFVCAILSTLTGLAAYFSQDSSTYSFESVIGFLLTGALTYGTARVTVNCVKGNAWDIKQVFCGFKDGYVKTLSLHFLHSLYIVLWSLLLVVPGIIKSYSYAMVYYLQQEEGGLDREPKDLITESRHLMDGYKWQLFCLDLSFIGWYILGALCLGIGSYFVVPYHQMARANFYMALRAERGLDISMSQTEEETEETEYVQ